MSGSKSSGSSRGGVFSSQIPVLEYLYSQGQNITNQQLGAGSSFNQGILQPATDAFQSFLQPQQNPFLQGQIEQGQELINRNLTENILPSIGQSAGQFGQRGSSRQGVAEGIAARSAIEQSSDFAENLLFADYNRQQTQALQALSMAPQLAGLQFAPLSNLAQIVGRPTVLNRSRQQGKSLGFGG